MTHLSIIVPVYNSAGFLLRSLEALDEFANDLACATEIIVVDDGSIDQSADIAADWASQPRKYCAYVIPLDKNSGKGAAVARGMLAAKGTYRVFLDVDLAYPPSQILKIFKSLEKGNDVVVASRVHPDSRYTMSPAFFHYLYTRHVASRIINWFLSHTIIPNCHDAHAGLKGFKSEAAEAIFGQQIIHGFTFDVEALFLAKRMGKRICEVPIEFRYFNEPTTVAFLSDGMNIIRDIFRIRAHHLRGGYKFPTRTDKPRLAIVADDFGMTLPISQGIIKAIAAGTVRSASIMSNSPDFEASMDELMAAKIRPDVGFHATLTWGRPVLDPKDIPTLVDKKGGFFSKGELFIRIVLGLVSADDVLKELRAQCDKLSKLLPQITHLDGHHHVHTFPVIREVIERVAREFGIPIVRAPCEGFWSPWHRAIARRLPVMFLKASSPAYWRGRGFLSTDHFGGFSLGGRPDLRRRWAEILARMPSGTTGIMVHPGFASEDDDCYSKEREEELNILGDPSFVKTITDAGIELISFSEMA